MKVFQKGRLLSCGEHVIDDAGATHPYENFAFYSTVELAAIDVRVAPDDPPPPEPIVAPPAPVPVQSTWQELLAARGHSGAEIAALLPKARRLVKPTAAVSSIAAFGGLVWRLLKFERAGDHWQGHRHALDHVTWLMSGAVMVEVDDAPAVMFDAPAIIQIPKESWHRFTALKDGTVYACVFRVPDDWSPEKAAAELPVEPAEFLRHLCGDCTACAG